MRLWQCSKEIENFWKRYFEEGVSNDISVAKFFESNGIPYYTFEKWCIEVIGKERL